MTPHGNPTVRCLELKLADLEGAEDAVATSTQGLTARMSTPWVANAAALPAEGASENVS